MKRVASLAVAVALVLGTQQALALGLGRIQVKSALGQPLLAEIPLRFDNAREAKSLHLAIASPADYQRAGISTNQMAIPLQFAVITTPDGGKAIRVTTADPVRDPYIDFLLDAGWANGKLIREYTVLLDPPGFASSAPVAVPAPHSARLHSPPIQQPAIPATSATPATTSSTSVPSSAVASSAGNGSYTVHSGDTLYAIAQRNLPAGVNIDQMLRALQQENPQAFIHDNINELKRGAILRIPSAATASAIPPAAARAAVRRQIEDWRGRAPQPLLNASSAAATQAPTQQAPAPSGGRLELVPPARGGGAVTRAGVKGGTGDAAVAGLKRHLARAEESLASEKMNSADLKARVEQLQQLTTNNAKLLALKNNEIAQLQAKLAQVESSATARAAAVVTTASPVSAMTRAGAPAVTRSSTPAHAGSVAIAMPATPASVAATPPTTVAKPALKPVVKPRPLPEVETPFYMRPMVLGGAAIVILLGLLGFTLGRKRKPAPAPRASLADEFAADGPMFADAEASASADAGHVDEDAAQLQTELQQHPHDLGLYLELASLQYARSDADAFVATAEAMHAQVDDPGAAEWQAVVTMGAELRPQHALFAGAAAATETRADSFDAAFDLAESAPELAEPGMAATQPPLHQLDAHVEQGFEDPYAPMTGTSSGFDSDPIDTKLDLARAYLDMGDREGARSMLEEVLAEGSQLQKDEAQRLLDSAH
ncbi:FimV/HubP family polar landmark protein [Metallibacterium sp.]|uniref:FimV/HubP family polar landmark protein n=1 Tax=Metallibacterium sp. TaxID=2940281 RepID=UPI002614A927|nr:FimV/HubP family polar landmark protein [Metallibacterium sp.]